MKNSLVIMGIYIRKEKNSDHEIISKVNDTAFGQSNEGLLVERLRNNPRFINELSLVAEVDKTVVGHILFFPIKIRGNVQSHESLALAPMAVLPEFQKQGIGGQLIQKGFETSKELGFRSVIVVGHKDYYPKFGFKPANSFNINPPFRVSVEVFMAIELAEKGLQGISGTVEYPTEFNAV